MEIHIINQYNETRVIFFVSKEKEDLAWNFLYNEFPQHDTNTVWTLPYNKVIQLSILIEDISMYNYINTTSKVNVDNYTFIIK